MRRQPREFDVGADIGAAAHFEQMSNEAEARDVDQRVHAGRGGPSAMPGVLSCVTVEHRTIASSASAPRFSAARSADAEPCQE
jgi:hypothetical protein